jgi:hypothetical protein
MFFESEYNSTYMKSLIIDNFIILLIDVIIFKSKNDDMAYVLKAI